MGADTRSAIGNFHGNIGPPLSHGNGTAYRPRSVEVGTTSEPKAIASSYLADIYLRYCSEIVRKPVLKNSSCSRNFLRFHETRPGTFGSDFGMRAMAVRVVSAKKGGVGKTTASAAMAGHLAFVGRRVLIVDCDPLEPFGIWSGSGLIPDAISIVTVASSAHLEEAVEYGRADFEETIIDLAAGASQMMLTAMALSDIVLLPTRLSTLDVIGVFETRELCVEVARKISRPFPVTAMLPSAVSALQWKERATRDLVAKIDASGMIARLPGLSDRAAFRAIFSVGATLETLPPEAVTGVAAARSEVAEMLEMLDHLCGIEAKNNLAGRR